MDKINVNEFVSKDNMDDYIEQLMAELKKDQDVLNTIRSLKLTVSQVRNNIAKLMDYKDNYNYCKNCPGLDKCAKDARHLEARLSLNGNHVDIDYSPCAKVLRQLKIDSLYLYFDAPEEWKNATLSNVDLSEKRNLVISEFLDILQNKSSNWLYLYGNRGVGKSYLLVTFANEFVERDLGSVAIIDCARRFKELADASYKDPDAFSKMMDDLAKVDLLVLRNFGREYKNDYLRDQIVYPLLSERASANKLTFFSSDFALKDIEVLYGLSKSSGKIISRELANLIKSSITEEYDLSGVRLYR